ncbi:MAG: hypothetical protein ACOCZE_04275 [Planctomycetota bacterium]
MDLVAAAMDGGQEYILLLPYLFLLPYLLLVVIGFLGLLLSLFRPTRGRCSFSLGLAGVYLGGALLIMLALLAALGSGGIATLDTEYLLVVGGMLSWLLIPIMTGFIAGWLSRKYR